MTATMQRRAAAARARRVYRLKASGQWQDPYTDATPVREHVRALMAYGIGTVRIADLAGVTTGTIQHLLYGRPDKCVPPAAKVRVETALALLAVKPVPANLGDDASVDATGSRRRLQALAVNGWSAQLLADALGTDKAYVLKIMAGDRAIVTVRTARKITALYGQLWNQDPPMTTRHQRQSVTRVQRAAADRRWAPPLAWDDADDRQPVTCPHCGLAIGSIATYRCIDDPAAMPWKCKRSPRQRAETLAAEWTELAARGYTRAEAADRLGVSKDALDTAIARTAARERAA